MASIKKRKDGKWRARYRDPAGKEHARHFDRKVDAEQWLDATRGDLVRGTYVDPLAGKRPFAEYASDWQTHQVHRATTSAQLETNLRLHVLPYFGSMPMSSVRPSHVQAWVKDRSEHLSPSTLETVYRYVVAIFRAAAADRVIASSPCVGIKRPRPERKQIEPLATEQVEALIAAVPERYRGLIITAAGTGLRQGEAFGLAISSVDFLRRQLRVDRQLVTPGKGDPYMAPPKTDASYRTVPLPDVVLDALSAHLRAFPTADLVFTNERGEPIRRNRFGEVWRKAAKAAELPEGRGSTRCGTTTPPCLFDTANP